MNKIDKLKIFLQENYPNEQAFNTRNIGEWYIVKTADEMFEELGYKQLEDKYNIDYIKMYSFIMEIE